MFFSYKWLTKDIDWDIMIMESEFPLQVSSFLKKYLTFEPYGFIIEETDVGTETLNLFQVVGTETLNPFHCRKTVKNW